MGAIVQDECERGADGPPLRAPEQRPLRGTSAATCATAGEAIALSGCAAKAACSTLSACSAGMKVKHDRSQTTLLTGLRLKQLGAVLQVDIAQASTLCAGDPCTVNATCKRLVSLDLALRL